MTSFAPHFASEPTASGPSSRPSPARVLSAAMALAGSAFRTAPMWSKVRESGIRSPQGWDAERGARPTLRVEHRARRRLPLAAPLPGRGAAEPLRYDSDATAKISIRIRDSSTSDARDGTPLIGDVANEAGALV